MEKKTHTLKISKEYFNEVLEGRKTFEVRKNDRDFKIGEILILTEWDAEKKTYTGNEVIKEITYILKGGQFGIENEYVVMSII